MSLNILLIEDSEVDYELFGRILKDIPVRWVKSTKEASSYLAKISAVEFPSIIVMDLNLPAENGIKLIHRLKIDSQFKAIPIIVLSSISDQKEIDACYEMGANAYIEKTLRTQDIALKLNCLVDFWLKAVHLPTVKDLYD